MKRLLGLLVSLLMLGSTLGLAVPTAQAGCDDYVPCEPAYTSVAGRAEVPRTTRPVVRVEVEAAGNQEPVGRIRITIKRLGGGFTWTRTFGYPGGEKRYRGPRVTKLGRHEVKAVYLPKPDTYVRRSSDVYAMRVVRRG